MRMRKKRSWRSVISVILVVAIALGACGAVVSFAKSDTKTIGAGEFTRGSLNEADGTYVKGKTSIVTEKLFECKGLKVIPDFQNTSQYQVFWYNADEIYLGASDKISASTKMVGSVPGAAVYARIVIYPSQIDDNGKPIKDFEVKLWQVAKYKKNIKIEVARDQAKLQQNLFNDVLTYNAGMGEVSSVLVNYKNILFENHSYTGGSLTADSISDDSTRNVLLLDSSNVSVYRLDMSKSSMRVGVYFFNASGTLLTHLSYDSSDIYYINVEDLGVSTVFQVAFEIFDGDIVLSEYLYRELL